MRINITSVFVDDQDKALKFYTEVLGFVKKTEVPLGERAQCIAQHRPTLSDPRTLLVLQRLEDVEPRGATRREDRGHDPDEDRGDREDDQLHDGKCEVDEVHARHEQGPENDAEGNPERAADH